ncbi:hypothetical protein BT96DRAFT_966615 [Gymnopus androsaceus JB14]|uniref:Core domain-containing protein n=1 Tax=Gymnopus androsaceus JB14 TaxID=1447944 RepID=A0A6A4HDR2_9AGAR|nr:hypothetical protein BT96DRAFT_966615 [Gymnopus androsaceus JB14]
MLANPSKQWATSAPRRTTTATQHLPSSPTIILSLPSTEYLKKEEIDVELLPPEDAKVIIMDRTAEQLQKISEREKDPNASLRVAVESGGCHGYQYKMELAKTTISECQFSHPTIKPANIVVDAVSLTLLNGATIDFATELIGSSFRISDNPHSNGKTKWAITTIAQSKFQ